ncbi:MAG: hypothetical protein AABY15_02355 [Nanoarchaeota archaeon]
MGEKSLGEILESNLEKRKLCDERGYHRIEKEPETENNAIVCYDCNLGFDKMFAEHLGIKYIVEPKEKR